MIKLDGFRGIGPEERSSSIGKRPSYFFLAALAADLVVVPAAALGVTALMTPTATVCLMSRTAKRPRGGKSEKASTHMGLDGAISTMAASPFLIDLGKASNSLPERRSHLHSA